MHQIKVTRLFQMGNPTYLRFQGVTERELSVNEGCDLPTRGALQPLDGTSLFLELYLKQTMRSSFFMRAVRY
jgi:hypothetical protein